jgi:hypothetical protein
VPARRHSPSSNPKKTIPDATAARLHNWLIAALTGITASRPKTSIVAHIRPLPMTGEVIFSSHTPFAINWRYAIPAGDFMYDFCWRADQKDRASPRLNIAFA